MEFLLENWSELGVALVALGTAARVIVKLTPTDKDDKALAKVMKFLGLFGLHLSK